MEGASISRWIRNHVSEIIRLSQEECWSWQDLAEAMNQAGIRYSTARPWSADLLSNKVARARRELSEAPHQTHEVGHVVTTRAQSYRPSQLQAAPALPFPAFDPNEEFEPIDKEPEFKVATLRGWSKPSASAHPAVAPRQGVPADPQPQPTKMNVNEAPREFLAHPHHGAIPLPQPLEPEDD